MMEDEKKRKEKDFRTQLMMLDIDGVLNQHQPDTEQMMTAAQAIATSAIGQLVNTGRERGRAAPLCRHGSGADRKGTAPADSRGQEAGLVKMADD